MIADVLGELERGDAVRLGAVEFPKLKDR